MHNKTGSRPEPVDYQDVLTNYARILPHFGVTVPLLRGRTGAEGSITDEDQRHYLLSDPHSLTRLVSSGFPATSLQHLDRKVPLHYYAELQEHNYDPMHLVQDSRDHSLTENYKESPQHPDEEEHSLIKYVRPSIFKPMMGKIRGFWVEGGLPQYVAAVKAGASRDDIHRTLNAAPRNERGVDDLWRFNPLDLRYTRVQHPLGMLGTLLRAPGGSTDEFLDKMSESHDDSARLSAHVAMRAGGLNRSDSERLYKIMPSSFMTSYFDGLKGRIPHAQLFEAVQHSPNSLEDYVHNRLTLNLGHKQSIRLIKKKRYYDVDDSGFRSLLKPKSEPDPMDFGLE